MAILRLKCLLAAEVTRGKKKIQHYKDMSTRIMSQSKFDDLKTEMPRLNIDILGINELNWNGMGWVTSY